MDKVKPKKTKMVRKIYVDDYELELHLDRLTIVNGYIPIKIASDVNETSAYVITGVLDKNMNIVVPFRKKLVSKTDVSNGEIGINVNIFENDRAIYEFDNQFYVIDLKTTGFKKMENDFVPSGYYFKFDYFFNNGDGKIVGYYGDRAFIYNVINNKFESKIYNYIKQTENPKYFVAYLKGKNDNIEPFYVSIIIGDDFYRSDVAMISGGNIVYLPKSLKSNLEIKKYCDDCYNTICELIKDDGPCKTLIQ